MFTLGLCPGEIAVYGYLLYCEDRKTYQCYPGYKTIGRAVGLSSNTVRKYVMALEEKGLIETEPTKFRTKDGAVRNGTLLYTIRPIQEVLDVYNERQARKGDQERQYRWQATQEPETSGSAPCH